MLFASTKLKPAFLFSCHSRMIFWDSSKWTVASVINKQENILVSIFSLFLNGQQII